MAMRRCRKSWAVQLILLWGSYFNRFCPTLAEARTSGLPCFVLGDVQLMFWQSHDSSLCTGGAFLCWEFARGEQRASSTFDLDLDYVCQKSSGHATCQMNYGAKPKVLNCWRVITQLPSWGTTFCPPARADSLSYFWPRHTLKTSAFDSATEVATSCSYSICLGQSLDSIGMIWRPNFGTQISFALWLSILWDALRLRQLPWPREGHRLWWGDCSSVVVYEWYLSVGDDHLVEADWLALDKACQATRLQFWERPKDPGSFSFCYWRLCEINISSSSLSVSLVSCFPMTEACFPCYCSYIVWLWHSHVGKIPIRVETPSGIAWRVLSPPPRGSIHGTLNSRLEIFFSSFPGNESQGW